MNETISKIIIIMRKYLLLLLCLIGIFVGLIIGICLHKYGAHPDLLNWLGIPGELFMNALKLIVVPLLVSNVITKSATLDIQVQGKLAGIALLYAIVTNFIGSFLAIGSYAIFQPGKISNRSSLNTENVASLDTKSLGISDILADFIRNMVPDNAVDAYLNSVHSLYTNVSTNGGTQYKMVRSLAKSSGTNILGLVLLSVSFGAIARKVGLQAKPFVDFFEALTLISVELLNLIIWFLPIGVCSLVISAVTSIENLTLALESMGWFVLAVTFAVFFHQFINLPMIYFLFVRKNSFVFFFHLRTAWITGFGTTSSLVAIPSIYSALDKVGVPTSISRCVIPLIVNFNANGSAAFICLATLFVAQFSDTPFQSAEVFVIGILSAIGVMALPAIPSASLITVTLLLSSFQRRTEYVSLLFAMEFLLDRFRTTTNIMSHGVCVSVVNKLLSKNDLIKITESNDSELQQFTQITDDNNDILK